MEKIYCKYHRQAPARWACPSCKVNLCPQCVKTPSAHAPERFCPLCKGSLSPLAMSNLIPPFWERIPQFFAYPATFDNLVYIGMLSVLSLATFLPIVGGIVPLLVLLATLKYAYGLLEHTALGNMQPPTRSSNSQNSSPYKQFVIFILMFATVAASAILLGKLAGILTYAAVIFAIPASVMSLAMTGSLLFAMNPVNLVRLIAVIGWPYCLLYVFLLLLSSGSGVVTGLLMPVLPFPALLVLSTFISAYFIFIMFHMMGYAIYQYHEDLGLEGVKEYQEAPKAKAVANPSDELMVEVNILISEGRIDEAKARLKQAVRYSADPEHFARYHKLLLLGEDSAELGRHGKEYINLLLAKGQKHNALTVFVECVDRAPGFALDDAAPALEIAQTAMAQNRSQEAALRLLEGFAERYPRNPKIPAAGLLRAKLLCEFRSDDARAKAILQGVLRDYPQHGLTGEIQQYLQLIGRLQSVGKIAPSR